VSSPWLVFLCVGVWLFGFVSGVVALEVGRIAKEAHDRG
jgi:hypothetical protein